MHRPATDPTQTEFTGTVELGVWRLKPKQEELLLKKGRYRKETAKHR